MPESIVLGNGNMLVGLDEKARLQDLYYDYVGLEDHITPDAICKIGVWIDGKFSWVSDDGWEFEIDYQDETAVSDIKITNQNLKINLEFSDLVYNEKNIFLRNLTVTNLAEHERFIKVYFNHQLRMYGVEKKDTVYYDPADKTIVHYKGRRVALIGGTKNGKSFDDFSVGLSNIEGKAGTWMDAEDGKLSCNPIEHGTVDSTISFDQNLDAGKSFDLSLWVCLGKHLSEVKDLHKFIIKKRPAHITESTKDYWHAWVNKTDFSFYKLDKDIIKLFKKSLFIIRAHVDDTGGIIASSDSGMLQYGRDNYSYVWHRDGALVAMALDKARYFEVSKRFYRFSNETITKEGYFFHKYRSDKSLGSSWHGWMSPDGKQRIPIQEDETALMLSALWRHYEYTTDLEFIEEIYNSLIKKAGEFMLGFRNEKRLPNPTFDLWEEKWGIHTFTAACVYDALVSASKFAELLGKEKDQLLYEKGAKEVKDAILEHLYSDELKYFYKYVDFSSEGGSASGRENYEILHDKTLDASSFYAVFKFGVLDIGDKRLEDAFKTFKSNLLCGGNISGVARYLGDVYYRTNDNHPGNPWIITTLWMAQYEIAIAKNEKDMEEVKKWLNWVVDKASSSGMLPEQVDPDTGAQISARPLVWSHGEFVTTVIAYLEKLEELGICKVKK